MPAPARTSREAIVRAARELLEADGLQALTMQSVAAKVGVRAPSLYKHVRDRGQLVRLVAEDVAGDLADELERAASTGDARADLRGIAHAFRGFAHANPAAYGLVFAALPDAWRPAPDALAAATQTLLRTTAALTRGEGELEAARTVVAWAHGFVGMELADAFRLGGSVDDAYEFGIDRLVAALQR